MLYHEDGDDDDETHVNTETTERTLYGALRDAASVTARVPSVLVRARAALLSAAAATDAAAAERVRNHLSLFLTIRIIRILLSFR